MAHQTLLTACRPMCSPDKEGAKSAPTIVDPQDIQWQAGAEFGPDKESSWSYPKEKDGWMLAHNAIRREVADMKLALARVVERGSVQKWEISALRTAWAEHFAHINAHHSNEDEMFNPFLATRIRLPEKLKSDHDELLSHLNLIDGLITGLSTSAAKLHDAWVAYEQTLLPHLEEEELGPLPLMRAYFKPDEVSPIVQKIVGKGPPCEMGSLIHYAGEEAFFQFMKQEGIPGFVWYLELKSKRDNFQRSFVENIKAVMAGTPPQPPSSFLGWCCQAQTGNDEITVPTVESVFEKQP